METGDRSDNEGGLRVSGWGVVVGLAMLAALVIVVVTRFDEVRKLFALLEHAEPGWLAIAVLFQVGTYACAGAVWSMVLRAEGKKQPIAVLARFSIEQLSVNQLMPASGLMGNVVVLRAMRRRGVPTPLAVEAIVAGALSHYAAFALASVATVSFLWVHGDLTPILLWLVSAASLVIAALVCGIVWILYHRRWTPPAWILRSAILAHFLDDLSAMTAKRVRSPLFLARATVVQCCIFVLDGLTLWAALHALGTHVDPLSTFAATVVAAIAATVSFIPGGLGSYEAACTGTLTLLGVPLAAALAGTLLLRGLALWLPLIPGFLLARQEIAGKQLHPHI